MLMPTAVAAPAIMTSRCMAMSWLDQKARAGSPSASRKGAKVSAGWLRPRKLGTKPESTAPHSRPSSARDRRTTTPKKHRTIRATSTLRVRS